MERGHASPMEMPSIWVRLEGQIGPRPLVMTPQRVGRRTMGAEEAWVVGWEIK